MTIDSLTVRALLTLTLGLAGCASTQVTPTASPQAHAGHGMHAEQACPHAAHKADCPLGVPGAHLQVEDVEGGVALVFSTETGDVVELQRRVHAMAEHHGQGGQHGMGHGMPMHVATTTKVEDLPMGARMVQTPVQAGDLATLRKQAHEHAGQCQ